MRTLFWWAISLALAGALGFLVVKRLMEREAAGTARPAGGIGDAVIPVEVASVDVGEMRDTASFSGTLESPRHFAVSPKIAGRLLELRKDVGDPVRRGEIIAVLDDDEYRQAVDQAEAALAVQRANATLAAAELAAAERDLRREENLLRQGASTQADYDRVEVACKAKEAQLAVAEAQVARSVSELDQANTRHNYTRVVADWGEGDEIRYVSERMAQVGDTLRAHDPICSVIDLDVLTAVVSVTEIEYAKLSLDAPVVLKADAFPGRSFTGVVKRVPPMLRVAAREAQVEVEVPNADLALKPGMFVRASIEFGRKERATVVPENAPIRYNNQEGVFLAERATPSSAAEGDAPADAEEWRARFVPIRRGYADRREQRGDEGIGRIEVAEPVELAGWVVTLGQQMISDGARISFTPPRAVAPIEKAPAAIDAAPMKTMPVVIDAAPTAPAAVVPAPVV